MSERDEIARAWHEGSDHARDGSPFGGGLCNCENVADRLLALKRWWQGEAWREGWVAGRWGASWATNPHRTQEDER